MPDELEIVKVCYRHGELTISDIYNFTSRHGKPCKKCKKCCIEANNKYNKNNIGKYLEYRRRACKRYRSVNRDRLIKIRAKQRYKDIINLSDSYVKTLIKNNSILKSIDITDEFVNLKRIHILMVREIRKIKKQDNICQ